MLKLIRKKCGEQVANLLPLGSKLESFIQPIFDVLPINYAGMDVALDKKGNLIIIEPNKSSEFSVFVRDNGIEPLVEMTKYILQDQTSA